MKPKRTDRGYLIGWFKVRPKGTNDRRAASEADEYRRKL